MGDAPSMNRNIYDQDVTTFSPAGRLHQVEYAMEAVKQGSAVVGLRSNDTVVLASLRRRTSELGSYQHKLFKTDEHMGMGIAGLIADARTLHKFLIGECINHRYVYDSAAQVSRLANKVSDMAQRYTQEERKRPYGVGLLLAGYDKTGAHLFQTDPSGNFYEYYAQAMGARSQSARTYLEKHFETFPECDLEQLIVHALTALKGSVQDHKITRDNVSVAFVGKNHEFTILRDDDVAEWVDKVADPEDDDDEDDGKDDDAAAAAAAPTPMEED